MSEPTYQLLTLSAQSEMALREVARRLATHVREEPSQLLPNLVYTYQAGKQSYNHRWVLPVANQEELAIACYRLSTVEDLASLAIEGTNYHVASFESNPEVAFLFTGQGAQYSGMVKTLYATSNVVRDTIDACAKILEGHLLYPLLDYLFNPARAEDLQQTEITQPVLFAVEYAIAQLWMSWGIKPAVVLGHSLGEYVAACVAGALSLEASLLLVLKRGQLMHEYCQLGAMVSVLATPETVEQALIPYQQDLQIAAINAHDQVVVSGDIAAIEALCKEWEQAGLKYRRLSVSHAFHSALMEPMLASFTAYAQQLTPQPLHTPLISNLNGELLNPGTILDPSYWRKHIRQPIQFVACLETLKQLAIPIVLEIGSHPVLTTLARKVVSDRQIVLWSLKRNHDEWFTILSNLGQCWTHGSKVDWRAVHSDRLRHRVHVPTYPFELREFNRVVVPARAVTEEPKLPMALNTKTQTVTTDMIHGKLISYWQEIFGQNRGALHENFLDLGGDSLNAIQLQARIREDLKVEITIQEFLTIKNLAAFIELVQQRCRPIQQEQQEVIPRLPSQSSYGLSNAQKRIWFLEQFYPTSALYNVPTVMRFQGPLDVKRLRVAFQCVIQYQASLRTVFKMDGEEPVQVILSQETHFELPMQDWTTSTFDREARLHTLLEQEIRRPFHLELGPLIRALLIKMAAQEYVLLLNIHHIIFDGWSMNVLMREVRDRYFALEQGITPEIPEAPIRYVDYAAWQKKQLDSGALKQSRHFWLEHLKGPLPVLDLPLDRPRPSLQTYNGATAQQQVSPALTAQLQAVARQYNITLYMLLLSAFKVLLYRYTGQTDIVVGTPVAGRSHGQLGSLIGLFVNTLALRTQLQPSETFDTLLDRVKATTLSAYEHQTYPFDLLVEELNPNRDLSRPPIFSVMFALQNLGHQESFGNLQVSPVELKLHQAKFDLTLFVQEREQSLCLDMEYKADLFDETTINRILCNFVQLLESIVQQPTAPLATLEIIHPQEYHQLTVTWNATAKPLPATVVQELLAAQAAQTPEAIAVRYGDRSLTYEQLDTRANQFAQYLCHLGVGVEMPVALLLERSLEMVWAVIGVLKAGATYIPIDPTNPESRVQDILEASGVTSVITQLHLLNKVKGCGRRCIFVDYELEAIDRASPIAPVVNITPDNLAYIIFTSGSTGKPKGVQITHRGLVNYLTWAVEYYWAEQAGTFPLYSSLAFDLTVTSLFVPLLTGQTILVQPANLEGSTLVEVLAGATGFQSAKITPAHLELLVQYAQLNGAQWSNIQHLIVGGEALSLTLAKAWLTLYPNSTIYNEYGPTETVVGCTVQIVTVDNIEQLAQSYSSIPIGKPIANTVIYILDEQGQLAPLGVKGEIYIGGPGVARGYINRPDLTSERFIDNPFKTGESLYRSGDVGRYRSDGTLEYFGRSDNQIKLRGYRIELGEIEAALLRHPEIRECAIVLQNDILGNPHIVAYIVTKNQLHLDDGRSFLQQYLPEYMLPSAFVQLQAMPLTNNGKVNRSALSDLAVSINAATAYVAPRDEVEHQIATVWQKVLGVPQVGILDDFFDLGGHSLKVLTALVQLKPIYPVLKVQDFFQYRTVSELAQYVKTAVEAPEAFSQEAIRLDTQQTHSNLQLVSVETFTPPQAVFLTGATGFLGAHILHELLSATDAHIYCLVRPMAGVDAHKRLIETMGFYFGSHSLEQIRGRVKIITGDLAAPKLGLAESAIAEFQSQIDTIIHSGADVRHYGHKSHFEQVNIEATKYLLEIAQQNSKTRFHYVSTLSIMGTVANDPPEFFFRESDFDRGQYLGNIYLESKFAAEKSVRAAQQAGVPATIYRVGNLIGHSQTGKFQRNIETNAFYRMLKAMMLLQTFPQSDEYIDLTPVDYCSQALVQIALSPDKIGRTFHLCNPTPIPIHELISWLCSFGYQIVEVAPEAFQAWLQREETINQYQEAIQLIIGQLESESLAQSVYRYDSSATEQVLSQTDIRCPKADQQLINTMLQYGIKLGYFPKPKQKKVVCTVHQ